MTAPPVLERWGIPDASGGLRGGGIQYRWGGIQLTADRDGAVRQLVVVCLPQLLPRPDGLRAGYSELASLKLAYLPAEARAVPAATDESQTLYALGAVEYVFDRSSGALVKVVIS